jgi:hypothetical protein
MSYILIAYDLKAADSERYQQIETFIKDNFSTSTKLLNTTWIVITDIDCQKTRTLIEPIFKAGDKLFIASLTNKVVWFGLDDDIKNWIAQHMSK